MSTIKHDNDPGVADFFAGWDKRLRENEQLAVGFAVLVSTNFGESPSAAYGWPRSWAGP